MQEQIRNEEAIREHNLAAETLINRKAVRGDLFTKPLSKKEQIYDFIRSKGRVRTSDVIKFGLSIYTNRGDRYARDLAEEGRIWRMRADFKLIVFGKTNEEAWSTYEADR